MADGAENEDLTCQRRFCNVCGYDNFSAAITSRLKDAGLQVSRHLGVNR
jgi:hypothetical protein